MKKLVIAIDLDGTICTEERTFEKSLAKPIEGAIKRIQELYSSGHTIIIWTARGWEQFRITEDWLRENEIPFHSLLMGKPIVDLWIDDRALPFTSWNEIIID